MNKRKVSSICIHKKIDKLRITLIRNLHLEGHKKYCQEFIEIYWREVEIKRGTARDNKNTSIYDFDYTTNQCICTQFQ